jgi:hypothetical protein
MAFSTSFSSKYEWSYSGIVNIPLFLTRYWKAFVCYRHVGFGTKYSMN